MTPKFCRKADAVRQRNLKPNNPNAYGDKIAQSVAQRRTASMVVMTGRFTAEGSPIRPGFALRDLLVSPYWYPVTSKYRAGPLGTGSRPGIRYPRVR